MDDGFINISDQELEEIWRDKNNTRYSKEYLDSVHQELLSRGVLLENKSPEEIEKILFAWSIKKTLKDERQKNDTTFFIWKLILLVTVVSIVLLNESYGKLPTEKIEKILKAVFYAFLSMIVFFGPFYPASKDKFWTYIFFFVYLVLGASSLACEFVPALPSIGNSKLDFILLLCLYSFVTLALTYLSGLLVSSLKNEDNGIGNKR